MRVLPYVAAEDCLALKGGTAIHLFYQEMPRLGEADPSITRRADQDRGQSDIARLRQRTRADGYGAKDRAGRLGLPLRKGDQGTGQPASS